MSKQQTLNIRIDLELKAKLQSMADAQNRSLSNMVITLLQEAAKDKPKK